MKRALPETRRWTSDDGAARLRQAETLANMLDANGFSAATAADFGVGQWHLTALIAQVDDPSPETRAIVVRILRDKEGARAAAGRGFWISGARMASNDGDCDRNGAGESAVNHPRFSAFETWFARYGGRLERFVKNARRK